MPRQNRREFLATSSLAMAGVGIGLSSSSKLFALPATSKLPVYAHMPDIIEADMLRQLATRAMDAAKSAGASYADIRIADKRTMTMRIMMGQPIGSLDYNYSYGIRALVNGSWAFGYGAEPTPEGIARATQEVVATAKAMERIAGPKPNLPPIPAATGEWSTPIEIDPFEVNPDEHAYMCGAYIGAGGRVPDGGSSLSLEWVRETRVFSSTEGALITQNLRSALPSSSGGGQDPFGIRTSLPFTEIKPISAGFEILLGTELQEKLKIVTEEAVRMLAYPVGETDVGRFEAVADGQSVGALLGNTLLPALDLDRALGNQADEEGTSFLTLDDATLGQQRFSPQLSFRSDRSMPMFGAAKWDDEGVEIEPYPLVQNGQVVDFIGMRQHVDALRGWYEKNGKEVKSHGSAVAWAAEREPRASAPSIVVGTGSQGSTLDALVGSITDGVVIRGVTRASSDQQLTGGMVTPPMLFEVKKGRITRRLRGAMIQFRSEPLWKAVTKMGDDSTVQYATVSKYVGQPWSRMTQTIASPAAHFSEIDVTRFPRYNTSSTGGFFTL